MVNQITQNHNISIISMETDEDHIHLLIDCTPQHYIPNIIKALKGNTARFIFKEFPELKKKCWGGHLWNPSYFIATVSENTRKQVEEYIESQSKRRFRYKNKEKKEPFFT
jgi:REP-associated tyrosine transposase